MLKEMIMMASAPEGWRGSGAGLARDANLYPLSIPERGWGE
ncbi:MAG: hypothetical protein ACUVV5_00530 [Candidatus Aminicenantales bacterium]